MEFWRRLRSFYRKNSLERGLEEEIRFHIERQTEKNLQNGMEAEEAYRQALIKFGGVEVAKESTRDQFRAVSLENFIRDLRYAARALRRAPGFTIVATLTLALGIGATTAMFSVVNGILLRPLPYPEQDRLIELVHEVPGLGIDELFASPAIYFTYRDHSHTFESVGLWDWDNSPVTVIGVEAPEAVQSVEMTHEVLKMLGGDPIMGRGFSEKDNLPGSTPTVIINYGYWQRRFAGANPLGQTLIVDGTPRQVIGVLPQGFRFFDYAAEIFYPLQLVRSEASFPSFDGRAIARLRPDVSLSQANADVARMIPLLSAEFGQAGVRWEEAGFRPKLRWLKETVVGNLSETLWLLMGTIAFLMLIAVANVSNMVLVRTQSRRPELAIRTALGAGRADIARVVFAEATILGLTGGVAGVAFAYLSLPVLLLLGGTDFPHIMTVKIDPRVLLVSLGISLLVTVLYALIPVVHFRLPKFQFVDALHMAGRSATEGHESNRARHLLLILQVALALVLLIGSGLMIRTFMTLQQVDPGFQNPDNVLTFQLTIPTVEVPVAEQAGASVSEESLRLKQEIVERLAVVPGVESAGFSAFNDGLPLDGDGRRGSLCVEAGSRIECVESLKEIQFVSPNFFETLRTPVVAGRTFDWNDINGGRRVVLLSENLAIARWGSANAALGKRIGPEQAGPWWKIVGIVKSIHHEGLNQPAPETVIYPAVASDTASFVVRSNRIGTTGFLEDLQHGIWSVNKNLSLAGVQTLGDMQRRSMARTSVTLQLLAITGGMALILGLVGIYGAVSYAISKRRREIGIRLALGAEYGEIKQMFVRQALMVVGIGVMIGLAAAAMLTKLMESQLFGVSPMDPATHIIVALLLVVAAGLAGYVSAQRASSLNPVEVLKAE